jgi:hypothetical protein
VAAEGEFEAADQEVSDTVSEQEATGAEAGLELPEEAAAEAAPPAAEEEILIEATPEVGEPEHESAPVGDVAEGPGAEPEVEVPVLGQEPEDEQGAA